MATAANTQPITVGVDGSAVSQVAVDWAARAALLRGAPLKVVHVLNPPVVTAFPEVPMPAGYLQWQEDEGRRVLAAAVKHVQRLGGRDFKQLAVSEPDAVDHRL
jgi:nucleotide-binding universal stress UspA family protein